MIKEILDRLRQEPGANNKMAILKEYKDNETLKKVLYLANSNRIKYYLKVIPEYLVTEKQSLTMDEALLILNELSDRVVTGRKAKERLVYVLENTNSNDASVIKKIILKDLKIGIGSNINKVFPKLIEKTSYMGAKPYSKKLVDKLFEDKDAKVLSEIKMDGTYRNAIIRNNQVELLSRKGEVSYVGDAPFLKDLANFPDGVLNGELTIGGFKRYEANGMITSIIDIEGKRDEREEKDTNKRIAKFETGHGSYEDAIKNIKFTVWDIITLEDYFNGVSKITRSSRLTTLEAIVQMYSTTEFVEVIEYKYVTNQAEALQHFQETLKRGLEGTILKSLDGTWKDGKPNWQVKMKLEINIDLKIVGFQYGSVGTKNQNVISTLLLESSCGLLKTNPAGMKEDMMGYVTYEQEKLLGTIVEIRCCGLSKNDKGDWSTLHPSVVELRTDKDTCDSLKSAQEIEEMAKQLTI